MAFCNAEEDYLYNQSKLKSQRNNKKHIFVSQLERHKRTGMKVKVCDSANIQYDDGCGKNCASFLLIL